MSIMLKALENSGNELDKSVFKKFYDDSSIINSLNNTEQFPVILLPIKLINIAWKKIKLQTKKGTADLKEALYLEDILEIANDLSIETPLYFDENKGVFTKLPSFEYEEISPIEAIKDDYLTGNLFGLFFRAFLINLPVPILFLANSDFLFRLNIDGFIENCPSGMYIYFLLGTFMASFSIDVYKRVRINYLRKLRNHFLNIILLAIISIYISISFIGGLLFYALSPLNNDPLVLYSIMMLVGLLYHTLKEIKEFNDIRKENIGINAVNSLKKFNSIVLKDEFEHKSMVLIKKNNDKITNYLFKTAMQTVICSSREESPPKRGFSENVLFLELMKKHPDLIKIDQRVGYYYPDILIEICGKYLIDIEIDEPYDLVRNQELHYDSIDDYRNEYFVRNNIFVVRFAEIQVIQNIEHCISIIDNIIKFVLSCEKNDSNTSYLEKAIKTRNEFLVKRWTKEEARMMSIENYRGYLNG